MAFEGAESGRPTAGSVARRDVATCSPDETVAVARQRAATSGIDACVVVNDERVVLGLMRSEELARPSDALAADAMRPGPSTYRPHVPIAELAVTMTERELPNVPVTTSAGALVGLLLREDAVALQDR